MELYLGIFMTLAKLFHPICEFILKLFVKKQVKKLPHIRNKLLLIPAIDLADMIKRKEVSSEAVVKAYIDRIREVNPIINAVTENCFERALKEARKVDCMVRGMSPIYLQLNYPLLGVPFSVKQSIGVQGFSSAVGSVSRIHETYQYDAGSVSAMRAAGAIPICFTNTAEWCTGAETYNKVNGLTKNSHDLGRSPGGSSGGEASLISAGASVCGIGTDLAGSVRIPAHFCGIFAHKPTARVVSTDNIFPQADHKNFHFFACVGPMTRYAKDLKPLMQVLSKKNRKLRLGSPCPIENIKIYYDFGFKKSLMSLNVDESIIDCMQKAIDYLQGIAFSVEKIDIDIPNGLYLQTGLSIPIFKNLPDLFSHLKKDNKRDWLSLEVIKSIFGLSNYSFTILALQCYFKFMPQVSPDKIRAYEYELSAIKRQFQNLLRNNGVLLFPTFPTPAFRHYESLTHTSGIMYCQLFNFLGFPATHVPIHLNKDELPIGFQVVGGPYQDRLCIAVATELERAFGGWTQPQFYKKI